MEQQRGQWEVNNQVDAKRRSYSEAVIEGTLRTETVFMGDSILRKIDKEEDVVVFECKDPVSWFMSNKIKLPLKTLFCFLPYISTVSHGLLQRTEFPGSVT